MPTQQYTAHPTVEPASQPPPDYFHLEASPERFAAGAKGLEQFGQSVSGVADLWGQIQTDSQLNNAMKESNQAVDDFEKLRGQDALDAQAGLKQKLDEIHDHYVGGLGPKDKLIFDNAYRNYQYRYLNGKVDTHATTQGHEFATKTNNDTQALAIDTAAKNFNNPDVVEYQRHVARDAAVKQLHIDGMDREPGNVQEQLRRVDTAIYKGVAEAMYVHNPQGAAKYIEDHRTELGAAYAPLADQFRVRSENVELENKSNVMQRILGTADPIVRKGIADANRGVIGETQYKSLYPDEGEAPKSNVVPLRPAETPPEQAKRQLEEEKKKAPAQPAPGATPAKDELGRIGGQGASIQVPFNPLMATADGRAQLVEQGLKTYAPGTKLISSFGTFTVPPAGSTFQMEGKSYTVPGGKPAATPAPTAPAATTPQKQSEAAPGTLPFTAQAGGPYSPAQTAIARAIDSRTDKDLNVRQLPGNVLETARDVALHSGPDGLRQFMAQQGYPKAGAWCGEFAAAVVRSAGGTPPKDPAVASNWRGWGQPTAEPKSGDIAVRRVSLGGQPVSTGSTGSHVTFVENYNPKAGTFTAIGGNQGHGRATFHIRDYEFRSGMPEREAQR